MVALERELQFSLHIAPVTFSSLIYDRNQQWIPCILSAIECEKSSVFVVGALHLSGEHGLQRLLKDNGHKLLLT